MATRWLCALVGLAVLSGCADKPAAPIRTGLNGISRPATTAELYDGSYQGRATLVRAAAPGCPVRPRIGVVEIGDAVLTFPYQPNLIFTPRVQHDGSLRMRIGAAVLEGRIANDRLYFIVSTPLCETRYDMHFVWNHS